MDLSALPDVNTLISVLTPTVTVLVMFSKLRTNVEQLVDAVREIQKTISVLPVLALRAEQLEVRVDRIEAKVSGLDVRIAASEKDRENIHRQLDQQWGRQ